MSSRRVKADVVKSNKLRHSPYDKNARPQADSGSTLSRGSSSPPTQPESTSPSPVAPSSPDQNQTILIIPVIRQVTGTMRPLLIEKCRERYPNVTPRNDFDILVIATGDGSEYEGPEEGIYAWLDGEFAAQVKTVGSAADIMRVYIRPIPQSTYSIRLFPGAFVNEEYCMDFVHTATGEPVNSPFAFELYSIASSSMPGTGRVYSMRESFAWARKPGADRISVPEEETFLLRDGGSTC
ncbi:hypothetical protein C8Q80DRAFT_1276661 [Daedaleopsis nitida]|nr:hypothetical protein C8Q80DRAFT_1276661 [Daedaleopsis nitida]